MTYAADSVLDNGIAYLTANVDTLYLCSQAPTTRTEAVSTYALGSKTSYVVGSPQDGASQGRRVQGAAFTGGTVTASGTATHYAWVSSTELLVVEALSPTMVLDVGSGTNTFNLGALDYTANDATQAP